MQTLCTCKFFNLADEEDEDDEEDEHLDSLGEWWREASTLQLPTEDSSVTNCDDMNKTSPLFIGNEDVHLPMIVGMGLDSSVSDEAQSKPEYPIEDSNVTNWDDMKKTSPLFIGSEDVPMIVGMGLGSYHGERFCSVCIREATQKTFSRSPHRLF